MKVRPDDQEADYAIFGKIVLLWGHIEAALADIILTLTFPPLKLERHKGVPQPFGKKCELALRGLETLEAMQPIRQEAMHTINLLGSLHAKRSIIVHGYFQGLSINGYEFTIYNTRTKSWKFETFTEIETANLAQQIFEQREIMGRLAVEANRLRAIYHATNLRSL